MCKSNSATALVRRMLEQGQAPVAEYQAAILACRQENLTKLADILAERHLAAQLGQRQTWTRADILREIERAEREVSRA